MFRAALNHRDQTARLLPGRRGDCDPLLTTAAEIRRALRGLICVILMAAWVPADVPETPGASLKFVQQLQLRQLHRLAEVYCRQQLQRTEANPRDQAPLVLELLNALAGRALAQRELAETGLWDEAEAIAEDYRRQWGMSIASAQVDLRQQLIRLARANWLLGAADLDPQPEARRQEANDWLRAASRALTQLDEQVATASRSSSSRADVEDSGAWTELGQQIHFAAGSVLLRHAECYPDRSPDRVHLLNEALREFTSLARSIPRSDLTLESRLREIECHRRLHNLEVAQQRLEQFPEDPDGGTVQQKLGIQRAWLDLAQEQPRRAVQRLLAQLQEGPADRDPDVRGEAMLALVQAYVQLATQEPSSTDTSPSQPWATLALDVVRQMEQQVSTYWVRRAEMVLSIQTPETAGTAELEIMSRTAANFYRREQYPDALAAFRRAAELAQQLGLKDQAFTLGLRAAVVLHQTHRHQQAVDAFHRLAEENPNHPRAAQAHWLAITNAAQWTRENRDFAATYQGLLQDHLRRWPDSDWADEVHYWLGRLLQQQGKTEAAIDEWRAVRPSSTRFPETMSNLRQAFNVRLNALAHDRPRQQALARTAAEQFSDWRQQLVAPSGGDPLQAWDAELTAAEFRLFYDRSSAEVAASILSAPDRDPIAGKPLENRARALLGLAQALRGNEEESSRLWDQIDWDQYPSALPLVARLHETAEDADGSSAMELSASLSRLTWRLVEHLRATERWRDNPQLETWGGLALARIGRRDQAIEVFETLAAASPDDAELQRILAELAERGDHEQDWQRAVEHWRQVVRLSPAADRAWFQAKLGIARGLIRTKQEQRAVEMIRVLQALHPDLGGAALRGQFMELLRQAGAS